MRWQDTKSLPGPETKVFFLSFMRHFPQIKKEGKRKREGNPSVIISFVFFAAFTRYQWVRSTIASPGKLAASCPPIPREITPKRSLVEVYYPQAHQA